jgi:uncharacterized membrane protein YtjA (UPF0391 family)
MTTWQMLGVVLGLIMAGFGFLGVLQGSVDILRLILIVVGLGLLVVSAVSGGKTNTTEDERDRH